MTTEDAKRDITLQIRSRIAEQGGTMRGFARTLGITYGALKGLMQPSRAMGLDTMVRLADALDCDVRVELIPRSAGREER